MTPSRPVGSRWRICPLSASAGGAMLRMLFWNVLLTVRAVRHTYDPGRPFGRRIIDRLRRQISAPSREIGLSGAHETFSSDAANFHLDDASADEAALHTAIAILAPDERL